MAPLEDFAHDAMVQSNHYTMGKILQGKINHYTIGKILQGAI
jgi:hypothetical protein